MAGNDFAVREATAEDIPALAVLGAELVGFHHALDPQRFDILSPHLEAAYARFLESRLSEAGAVVLVAEGDAPEKGRESASSSSVIVGYAFGW